MNEIKPQEQPNKEAQETTNSQATELLVQELVQKEVSKLEENYKKQLQGLNQRNSKLENELKEKVKHATEVELSVLSEKERAEKELEIARTEKERLEKETENIKRERIVDKTLYDARLPQDFAKRIIGATDEEIAEDVQFLKTFIDEQVQSRIDEEINKRLSGKAPKQGQKGTLSDRQALIEQYNEAEKNGNASLMMTLKDKIRKLPKD